LTISDRPAQLRIICDAAECGCAIINVVNMTASRPWTILRSMTHLLSPETRQKRRFSLTCSAVHRHSMAIRYEARRFGGAIAEL
jgi:hypothetical protein